MYDFESGPHDRLVQISSRAKNRLRAFPTGWFVVCFSDELRPGRILERKFMGQDLVVYRTASGKARKVTTPTTNNNVGPNIVEDWRSATRSMSSSATWRMRPATAATVVSTPTPIRAT